MDEINRKYHEVADIFPMMSGDEYEALKVDIAENGQREPIWLHSDGRIIDGRNRHRACVDLDIAPHFRTWDGNGSLVGFVVSLNLHRRHLDTGQRAMVGLKVKEALATEIAEQANERRRETQITNWHGTYTGGGVLYEFVQHSPAGIRSMPVGYLCFPASFVGLLCDFSRQCFFHLQPNHCPLPCVQMPAVQVERHDKTDKRTVAVPCAEVRRNVEINTCPVSVASVDDAPV